MAIGRNPDKERCYILACDRNEPTDKQTRWFYRVLPYEAAVALQDNLIEFRSENALSGAPTRTVVHGGSQERDILFAGLVRVENYYDEDGRPLQWPQGKGAGVREQRMYFLSTMLPEWRRELADAITAASTPTKQDESDLRFRGQASDEPRVRFVSSAGEGVSEAVPGDSAGT